MALCEINVFNIEATDIQNMIICVHIAVSPINNSSTDPRIS